MNKLHNPPQGENFRQSVTKTAALFSVGLALGAGFWMASSPIAGAAAITPAEMIQSNLPRSMSLVTAPKAEVLSAVCKSVSRSKKDAPDIVRTAAGARKDLTSDILKTALLCLKGDGKDGVMDCGLVRPTLNEAIAVDNTQAATLTELVTGVAPNCLDGKDTPSEGPGAFGNSPGNINPPPGGGGGGGGEGNVCTVCHNNQEIQIACSDQDSYLKSHPGDTAGSCQATAVTNR